MCAVTIFPKRAWKSVLTGEERLLPEVSVAVGFYLENLKHQTQHLTLLGLGRSLQVELPIAEAYVPLRTTLNRSLELRKTDRDAQGLAEHEEDVDLGEVFRKAADLGERGVVLLGEPGSGKTTGARQLAWRLASRQSLPEDLGLPAGMTPVFLHFRNLRRATLEMKNGLRVFLDEETRCDDAPEGQESPGADLWNGRAGGLLWILDGLDEVIDPEARKTVSGWVQRALRTVRQTASWSLPLPGLLPRRCAAGAEFCRVSRPPLDDDQVKRFVRDWFGAAYGKLLGPRRVGGSAGQRRQRRIAGHPGPARLPGGSYSRVVYEPAAADDSVHCVPRRAQAAHGAGRAVCPLRAGAAGILAAGPLQIGA